VIEGSAEMAGTESQLAVPVTTSLPTASVVVPFSTITDPGISGNRCSQWGEKELP